MMNTADKREIAIRVSGVKKQYKLGQIGGATLREDLQSWWAKVRHKPDPNAPLLQDERLVGKTFMALNGVDLTIYKGEAVGIIGSNGAGKSTLLKLFCRVTAPTQGEIDIYGRITSMLEVGTGFNGELTGRENIYMNGAILGMTKAEIDAKMEDIIEFSEVRDFIDTPVKRYSSGMFVKLGFAVASHLESEIMIMDEVLAVGDMAFQTKCLDKMRQTAREDGRTILYVSHNMNTIRKLCDRCIVLDKGKVVFSGDVEEAIAIYMASKDFVQGVDIDLSDRRMEHLPAKINAKMTRVVLQNKEYSTYKFREKMDFCLSVHAYKKIPKICTRLEVRALDGSSVGAVFKQEFASLEANSDSNFFFTADFTGLVPGKYVALLVLYEVNEMGTYNDLDAVYPAFSFEVVDSDDQMGIAWDHYSWGKIHFGEMKLNQISH